MGWPFFTTFMFYAGLPSLAKRTQNDPHTGLQYLMWSVARFTLLSGLEP
jgi:hypothetical protein